MLRTAVITLALASVVAAAPAEHLKAQAKAPATAHLGFGGYNPYGAYPFAGHPYGGYPYGGYPFAGPNPASPFPQNNPWHPAYGHPAVNPFHPLNNPFHPANFGGFAEEKASISAKEEPAASGESAAAPNPWAQQWANSAAQWKNYYSQPISQTQWPGANSRPGVHPTLGGTLNPYSPMGLPNHPYPFPMHQGLKNGKYHPRPFTPLGQYYPGTTSAPFLPGMVPGAGMYPTYFPAAHQGQMTAANAALQTSAKAKKN